MNIFTETDYRKILRDTFASRKVASGGRLTYDAVAGACRVQKTFISRVFNKQAHFNHDQLFALANYFSFDGECQDYLTLLLDHSRAATKPRQQYLKRKIEKMQSERCNTPAHLGTQAIEIEAGVAHRYAIYYLQPIHQIVHVALAIPRYGLAPTLLAPDLGITRERLTHILKTLHDLELIQFEGETVKILVSALYLPKEDHSYESWRALLRGLTASRLQTSKPEGAYSFSLTFAASEEAKGLLQRKFLEFLQEAKPIVEGAAPEDCFQMNFDLFSWTR